jgi:rSAM/selenodomain-associated transferase 2
MISIIIPTYQEAACIGDALQRVCRLAGDKEIIVADGGSDDGTIAVVTEFPDVRVVDSAKGRALQMNAGAQAATGDVFLFLHADTILPENALVDIESAMSDARHAGGKFRLQFDPAPLIQRIYSWFSRFPWPIATYGDQALFVRREVFREMGGYREMPIFEDVEFFTRLRKRGSIVVVRNPVVTSGRRFVSNGLVRQHMKNALLVCGYRLGVSPERLKQWYPVANGVNDVKDVVNED